MKWRRLTGIVLNRCLNIMVDMAMHLMDISQNSIRADAKNIQIAFNEDCESSRLTFRVGDDGNGMNEEELRSLEDPFFTTRTTRKVGLGIPLLKMTCEQTGGFLTVESEAGKGTIVQAVYCTDNPDCLPLGDIAGYLTMLIVANPDIRIKFTYRLNDKEFKLDTDELKEQEIDLRQSGLPGLLKPFIAENLKELFFHRAEKSFLC